MVLDAHEALRRILALEAKALDEDGPSALQAARCNAEPRDPRDRDGQKR